MKTEKCGYWKQYVNGMKLQRKRGVYTIDAYILEKRDAEEEAKKRRAATTPKQNNSTKTHNNSTFGRLG